MACPCQCRWLSDARVSVFATFERCAEFLDGLLHCSLMPPRVIQHVSRKWISRRSLARMVLSTGIRFASTIPKRRPAGDRRTRDRRQRARCRAACASDMSFRGRSSSRVPSRVLWQGRVLHRPQLSQCHRLRVWLASMKSIGADRQWLEYFCRRRLRNLE